MSRKLDPYTLRWVSRRLRTTQRQCFKSMDGFERLLDASSRGSAQFFRGFACSAMHEADRLLGEARAIERKGRKAKRKP